MGEPSDAEVIAASMDDAGAFGVVFDRHATTVHRYLTRRVGRNEADALLGETFRIAFERRVTYDTARAEARPWLYGIATNLVARHRRTEARRIRATARLQSRRDDAHGEDRIERVADAVAASVLLPDVVAAIGALPDGERDALLLHAWESLGYEDIARALDIPVGTVRSRLNRARTRLRELPAIRGEHLAHPDVFTRHKEQLMSDASQFTPVVLPHRSRMYPRLAYSDVATALEYLTRVFGFTEVREARIEEDGAPHIAWLEFGAGLVMISHPNEDVHRIKSPRDIGGTTSIIHVEVDDADAHHARAAKEGAEITTEPEDTYYGARRYEATDFDGHRWHFESPLG